MHGRFKDASWLRWSLCGDDAKTKLCVYLHCTHMLASCHILLAPQVIEGEKTLLFAKRLAWITVEGQEIVQNGTNMLICCNFWHLKKCSNTSGICLWKVIRSLIPAHPWPRAGGAEGSTATGASGASGASGTTGAASALGASACKWFTVQLLYSTIFFCNFIQ